MIDLLTPQLTVEPRPSDRDAARYVRSYLLMRVFVGVLGVALPLLLVFGDGLVFDEDPFPRDSLSAYYYSGTREVFVGVLSATAVFLIAYKVADRTLENTFSNIAGAAALTVALFPTARPTSSLPVTSLQKLLGERTVQVIHFGAATVFISLLRVISYFFGRREAVRPPRPRVRAPRFWRNFHWVCAGVIALALVWILVTQLVGWPRTSLLIGEAVAAWAFGASWLMKGLELDVLRRPRPPDPAARD